MDQLSLSEWQQHEIFTRPDGSFVITHNSNPYHVPSPSSGLDEFAELWAEVDTFATAHPAQVMAEPGPPEPTPEEMNAAIVQQIKGELDEIDRKSARAMRAVIAGTATDADQASIVELEVRAEALRIELMDLGG